MSKTITCDVAAPMYAPGRFVFTAHGEKDDLLMSVAEANGADRYWFPNDQVTWIVADSLETLARILDWFPNDQVTWIVADSLETLARILDQYTKRKIDQANIVGKTAQERRP